MGLGPGGSDLLTGGTVSVLRSCGHRYLRTARHPAAEALLADEDLLADGVGFQTFDHLYESCDTFAEVYASIVEGLLEACEEHGRIVYAVPGSPTVAESTVEALGVAAAPPGGPEVVVHPAMSFADLAWARLGVDPVELGARLVDGHSFAAAMSSSPGGPVLVAQCDSTITLSEIKLSLEEPPAEPVVLLQRLGLPDERIVELDWADIDRGVDADHLTSLWIPAAPPSAGGRLDAVAALMEELRVGDPWKAAQDHETLKRHLLEESYEVLEAIDGYDPATGVGAEELASELGDLLYQVVFHGSLAADAGWFDLAEVVRAIHDKLVARHAHTAPRDADSGAVGSDPAPTLDELTGAWERAKQAEHGRGSPFDGIPATLPALVRAMALSKKARALAMGFPEPAQGFGGELLAVALEAVAAGEDPEDSLRRELLRVEGVLRAAGQ